MKDALPARLRFGVFELDPKSGELREGDRRVLLQEQPFKVLLMLIERDREVATREEIKRKLWPNDTIVEFDHSINVVMGNLRRALGDSAEEPQYIETLARRGYRLLVPVEQVGTATDEPFSGDGAAGPTQHETVGLIGRKISHYRVLEVIGGGGMGLVYKAEDLKLGRRVALKFLPEELALDSISLQRFEREARTASTLNHRNICTIHEVEEHDGQPCIVMELLEGETLRDRLATWQTEPIAVDQMLQIAIQICDGLDAAYQSDIIHRDIKPANIFLTTGGQVKILDFGLAKFVGAESEAVNTRAPDNDLERACAALASADSPASVDHTLTRTGASIGTAGYMSPEQVRGEKLDARTDIFSFGLVLYEMATGQRAFSGETAAVVHDSILHNSPVPVRELNSTLPARLVTTIDKCIEKDRTQRFQSCAEVRADLQAVMPSGRGSSHRSAKKWIAAVVISFLVLAGVSALVYQRVITVHAPHLDLQNMKITSPTDNPKVGVAAISPDGRYVAYSVREPQQSLWVQQVAPESKIEVVPPSAGAIWAVAFSPDGNYLYFVRDSKGYVVPALGGTPRSIIEDTFGGIAVSPDGRKLAFIHGGDDVKSQLIVVNQDGSGAHVIAEHDRGSGMRFNSVAAPSWSPDGTLIAMPAIRKTDYVLGLYPAEGGPSSIIPLPGSVIQSLWLPDQSGLLLTISSSIIAPAQIWLQPFPKGTLQRLTNGLDGYLHLSLSKDGRSLAAVRVQTSYNMFVGPASKPDEGTAVSIRKSDGVGLAWMPDGNLLSQNVDSEFSSLTPDGKRRVTLFKDQVFPGDFSLCRNGRFIIFGKSTSGDSIAIWRLDFTGHNLKQLTEGPSDMGPDCSPDSESVIYASVYASQGLRRIPIDGGTPAILSDKEANVDALRYSPDGRQIADIEDTSIEVTRADLALIVRDSQTGQKLKSFNLPAGFDIPYNSVGRQLRWPADGQTVTYLLQKGAAVNLWSQSLDGGPPRQITNFPDAIVAYDWSPDGKQLALTRSTQSRDVVLITNFH